MINLKKIDDKDFVFINKPFSAKEEKAFSDFLKRKKKLRRAKKVPNTEEFLDWKEAKALLKANAKG